MTHRRQLVGRRHTPAVVTAAMYLEALYVLERAGKHLAHAYTVAMVPDVARAHFEARHLLLRLRAEVWRDAVAIYGEAM